MSDDQLADVSQRLDELTDLFRRRLIDDKVKQRAFDELYAHLEFAQRGLVAQLMLPLVQELVLLLDRMADAPDAGGVIGSFRSELLEVLRRRGVEEVHAESTFDPSRHEAVRVEVVNDAALAGKVLSVDRPGFVVDGRLIRPARVVVGSVAQPSHGERGATGSGNGTDSIVATTREGSLESDESEGNPDG